MPHQSFKVLPGVDQNKTLALNEAAISISQLIRFIPDRTLGGLVQKLGGWQRYMPGAMGSIVRCLWGWEDTNANSYLAIGAEGRPAVGNSPTGALQFTKNGASTPSDITPQTTTVNVAVNFATTAGTNAVVVTDTGRNADSYDVVDIQTQVSVGGLILFGQYQVFNPGNSANVYTIYASNAAGSPANAAFSTLASPISVTSASGTGTIATLNYTGPHTFVVGEAITVTGMGVAGYNGTYIVTGGSSTSVTYANTTTGASSGGTINNKGTIPKFTTTNLSSSVTVTLANHGYLVGDTFPILIETIVGGITLKVGNYIVTGVTSSSVFTISSSTTATSSTLTSPISVTGASGTGTTATLTYTGPYAFSIGDLIVVSGINPAGYNGTYVVTASTTSSVSYANATTGAWVSGGIINQNTFINAGNVRFKYYNGIGPLAAGTGYGIGPYGRGKYGTGTAPSANTGTPITGVVDWTLDNWGETLIACPLNGPIYRWNPTSGDPIALNIPNAPSVNEGAFVAMPQRQIVAWGSTFTGIKDPLLIRWCDVDNYDAWIGSPTNQAGSYRMPKGSRIVQCIQGPQQGLIWTDLGCWAMQYVGFPYVYQFNELGTGCGLIGRKAATSVNGFVYWMGPSQFYRLSGNGVEPVRCPVWDVVFQDLDTNNLDKIRVAPNSRFGEITWYFPTISNGGENEGYVKYNYNLDQWDYGFNSNANPFVARSAWINESVLGPPIGAALNQIIFQHETSPDADGAPMNSYFQTGYFALSEADVKMFIDQVWPDMKWGYFGGTPDANIDMTFYVTDYPGKPATQYGPFPMTQNTNYITPRFRGRLVSIRIESNDISSFWRLGNFRYRLQPDGRF